MNKSRAIGTAIVILLLAGAAFWLARNQKNAPTPPVGQNQNGTSTPTSTPRSPDHFMVVFSPGAEVVDISGKGSDILGSLSRIYRDPQGRFEFSYIADGYGEVSVATNTVSVPTAYGYFIFSIEPNSSDSTTVQLKKFEKYWKAKGFRGTTFDPKGYSGLVVTASYRYHLESVINAAGNSGPKVFNLTQEDFDRAMENTYLSILNSIKVYK